MTAGDPFGRVKVTAPWQAEMDRRRATYADQRRRWVEAWFRGETAEPLTDDDGGSRRTGGTIHDRRRFRFDF
jgi:hypothetical protein